MMAKKPYRLVPVALPEGRQRRGVYEEIIKDFMASGDEAALVEYEGRSINTVYQGLYHALKTHPREGIAARRRKDGVYLVRAES